MRGKMRFRHSAEKRATGTTEIHLRTNLTIVRLRLEQIAEGGEGKVFRQ